MDTSTCGKLDPELLQLLVRRADAEIQVSSYLRRGDPGHLVLHQVPGDYRAPNSISKSLRNVCEQAEINRPVSPHWMRHTFNNLMRQAKVDKVVLQATTGHSADAMTEHYSHVDMAEKKEATARVLNIVWEDQEVEKG